MKNPSITSQETVPAATFSSALARIRTSNGTPAPEPLITPLLKPWLTAKELGDIFNVHRDSIYRWRDDGTIPASFVRPAGRKKLLFDSKVVAFLESKFRGERDM